MDTRRGFLNSVLAVLGLSAAYVSDKHIGRMEHIEDEDKLRRRLNVEEDDFNINIRTNFRPPDRNFRHIVETNINIDKTKYIQEVNFDYSFHKQVLRAKKDTYISEISDNMRENLKLKGLLARKNIKNNLNIYRVAPDKIGEQKTDDEIRSTKNRVFEDWYPYYVKSLGQQNIDYEIDGNSTGEISYSRHPIESLVDGSGDCKDSTILMFSMLSNNKFDVGYASLPSHIGLLINKEHINKEDVNTWYRHGEDKYTFVEPNEKMDIGEHREFNRDDLIIAWTEKYGFDKLDISNIPNHVYKGSDIVTQSFSASFQ